AGIGFTGGKSAAVNTRPRASGGTEIDLIRAWACGLRTNATSIVPGSLMSETNWPRPCRCRSSSLRNSDAPTPYWSLGIGRRLLAEFLRRFGDGGHDVGVTGAAANVAGEAFADFALRTGTPTPDQITRGDQHCRRAEAALQRVLL